MDSEKQKPITDEYRKNWERIYLQQEARKTERKKPDLSTMRKPLKG